MTRLLPWIRRFGWLVLATGLLLRWWLRDLHPSWAPLFYALAPGVLVIGWGMLALLEKGLRRRLVALLMAQAVWFWPTASPRESPPQKPFHEASKRWSILFWNLARPQGLHQGALDLIRQRKPDLAAFVEPGVFSPALLEAYRKELPDHFVEWMPRGILWVSRALSRRGQRDRLAAQGAWASFRVEDEQGGFPVLVCDLRIVDGWNGHRAEQFSQLQQLLPRHPAFIVMGDFNTPVDSCFFDSWMPHGFHALSPERLPMATWPALLPLWNLDQVWLGSAWQVHSANRLWAPQCSDHAALWLEIQR